MTIAIGMLYDKGALLCADSLVTTGTLGSYQSKLLGYRINGADVVFALAGNVDFAESAWQLCRPILVKQSGKKRTAQEIADSLRPVLAREYQDQVIVPGYVGSQYDYSFLIVIRSGKGKAEIYTTYQKTLKHSRIGHECIGAGADLTKFLLTWIRPPRIPAEKLAEIAAYVVGTLKRQMAGVIGGNNLIMSVGDDGEILFYGRSDLQLIEQYAPVYEIDSYNLLWKFLDTSVSDDDFESAQGAFSRDVRYWRQQYKKKRDSVVWSAPPDEANEAIVDLRTTGQ
jgi:hypothetical protein